MKKIVFILLALASCSAGNKGGLPDYCYISAYSPLGIPKTYYHLLGHRKWDQDMMIGSYDTIDEAVAVAKKIECPFR